MGINQDAIPVKVYVRSRPFNNRENSEHAAPCITFYNESNQLSIAGKMFAFDSVMDPSTSQKTAFEITTSSLMDKIMKGFNCTILAYGQTGSGKTYTMGTEETTESMARETRGIIPRLVEQLFQAIRTSECPSAYQVLVSMLEIYDEKVNDLLSSAKDLQVREINGAVVVQGLTRNVVKDLATAMRQLEIGCQLRSKGETAMNATSSRSHAIFTISVDKTAMTELDTAFKAKLHLVDLAGSERLKKTQAEGERKKEGIRINEGLLALGNVISALSEPGGSKHIPYRDSKITRLLQDSLGGNSYTVMIACISPADTNAEETLSTLRYADRAKKIKNKPIVNEDVGQAAMVKQLQEKIRQLERQLAERGDSGVPDFEPDRKILEAIQQERAEWLRKEAALIYVKATCQERMNKATETLKEYREKLASIVQNGSIENSEEIMKQIETLAKTYESEVSDTSVLNAIEEADDENGEVNEYVARQSQLQHEIAGVLNELKMKDNMMEKTKNELEVYKQYEQEKARMTEAVDSLQNERDKLMKEIKKNTTCGKLAEERRQRVKELEGQIAGYRKQLSDYKKMEKAKNECEQKIKRMDDEIMQLKQARVKLQKAVKEENEKFRAQKMKSDRELNQLRAQERRKEIAHSKELQAQNKKLEVMRQKLEESQRTLKRFNLTQSKKNSLAEEKDMSEASIRKFLKQEINHWSAFTDTERQYNSLLGSRTSISGHMTANTRKIEKLRRDAEKGIDPEQAREQADALEKENEVYAEQVAELTSMLQALREPRGEYDENAAAEERFKSVQSVGQAKAILKVAFDMLCQSVGQYNQQCQKAATDMKAIQQLKSDAYRKERMFQQKLDEFLSRLDQYREDANTKHRILAGKLMNVSNEKGFHNLAQEFEQLRDELEADAEDLEKSIEDVSRHPKRASKQPNFFGHVVNSEKNIEGTPQAQNIRGKFRKSGKQLSISPITSDPQSLKERRRATLLSEPLNIENSNVSLIQSTPTFAQKLNETVILSSADENEMNSTFIKSSPKRPAAGIKDDAPPLKIRQTLDVSLGGIPRDS